MLDKMSLDTEKKTVKKVLEKAPKTQKKEKQLATKIILLGG
jgi:hypothetical protein